jgi:hypothetical protein
LRKYLIAGLAIVALVALSAVAVAQVTYNHTMTADTTVKKAGTKKKPKNATGSIGIVTDPDHEPSVDVFEYLFPKELKVSTKGFNYCTLEKLSADQTDANCPKNSKVGTGTARAYLGSRNAEPLNFVIAIYANKVGMTLWLTATGALDIRRAIPIVIAKGSGGYAQKLVADIPPDVEAAGGVPVILESVDVALGAKVTKKVKQGKKKVNKSFYVLSSVGCPSSKKLALGTRLIYKLPQGQQPTSAAASVNCS